MLFCHTVEGKKERKEGWEYINTRVKIRAADKHQFCVCGSGPAHTLFSSQHFRRRFSSVTSSGATNCTQFSLPSNFFFFFQGETLVILLPFWQIGEEIILDCVCLKNRALFILFCSLFFRLSRWKGFRCAAKEGKKRTRFFFWPTWYFYYLTVSPPKKKNCLSFLAGTCAEKGRARHLF